MSYQWHVAFWLVALALASVALWLLSGVLLPFVVGFALAYLLAPPTAKLRRLGVNPLVAALVMVAVVILALVVLALIVGPIFAEQLAALITSIPKYVGRLQSILLDPSRPWLQRIIGSGIADANKSVGDLISQGTSWLAAFLASLWSGGQALVSLFSLIVVTPVVTFYLIYDWDRMIARVDNWVPRRHLDTVRELAREIDAAIAGFVRGQSAVCLILAVMYAVALSLVGLNFGALIGLISGLIGFIPYVGSLTGLVLSVGVATAQFWPDWVMIVVVLGVFLVGQFIEGNILSPTLVGERVGLHPLWIIFALLAFGYLFGFVGLLLAVPLAAAIGVLARFGLRRYLASPFYTGGETQ
jgi:predicted PurR-regulated permease PerM